MRPFIESFDYMLKEALPVAVRNIEQMEVDVNGRTIRISYEDVSIGMPLVHHRDTSSLNRFLYPAECRERRLTYKADLNSSILVEFVDGSQEPFRIERVMGQV